LLTPTWLYHLRGVPILRPQDQSPSARPLNDSHHMDILRVGDGHRRTPAKGARGATLTCWSP
jgi:hypothetical protein